jgi:hypothetical protein
VANATTCDPLTSATCPSGQSCYLANPDPVCQATGATQPGQACSAINSCVRGASCLYDAAGKPICFKICNTASPSCPSTDQCQATSVTGVGICAAVVEPNCNPVASTCSTGQGCFFDGSNYNCGAAGTAGAGATCSATVICKAGFDCFSPDQGVTNKCYQYCIINGSPGCPSGQSCMDFGDPSTLGLGVCG